MENALAKNSHAEFSVERRVIARKRTFGGRALPGTLSISSIAVASAANSQSMFAHATNTSAAQGVEILGLAIFAFSGLSSLGMLVAGVWTTLHRRAEARARRR